MNQNEKHTRHSKIKKGKIKTALTTTETAARTTTITSEVTAAVAAATAKRKQQKQLENQSNNTSSSSSNNNKFLVVFFCVRHSCVCVCVCLPALRFGRNICSRFCILFCTFHQAKPPPKKRKTSCAHCKATISPSKLS